MTNSASKGVALVTGASSGIGAVYADRLASRGYDLILVARRTDRLEALAAKVSKAYGIKAEVVAADLTQDLDEARIEKIVATNPDLRVLVTQKVYQEARCAQ